MKYLIVGNLVAGSQIVTSFLGGLKFGGLVHTIQQDYHVCIASSPNPFQGFQHFSGTTLEG